MASRRPVEAQCEGCTFFNGQVRELSRLHSRGVTYATFCQGSYEESVAYRDFMGWDVPWYSAKDSADELLAGRWFGMQVCYLRAGDRVFETYWSSGRAAEALVPSYAPLDMTVYGRQEAWEDSPHGWPQLFATNGDHSGRTAGRPRSGRGSGNGSADSSADQTRAASSSAASPQYPSIHELRRPSSDQSTGK